MSNSMSMAGTISWGSGSKVNADGFSMTYTNGGTDLTRVLGGSAIIDLAETVVLPAIAGHVYSFIALYSSGEVTLTKTYASGPVVETFTGYHLLSDTSILSLSAAAGENNVTVDYVFATKEA